MGTPARKRRPASRSPKKKRARQSVPRSGKKVAAKQQDSIGNDLWAFFFGGVAAFVLLSIISVESANYVGYEQANYLRDVMGPLGRFVGTMLLGFLGWCSFVLVGWFAYLSVHTWHHGLSFSSQERSLTAVLFGSVGLLLFSCTLAFVVFGTFAGGAIGAFFGAALVEAFNTVGAALIAMALVFISLSLCTDFTAVSLVSALVGFTRSVSTGTLTLFGFIWSGIGSTVGAIVSSARWVLSLRKGHEYEYDEDEEDDDDEYEDYEDEEDLLPKPKVRKNRIDSEDELEEEELQPIRVSRWSGENTVSRSQLRKRRKKLREEEEQAGLQDAFYTGTYLPPELDLLVAGDPTVSDEDDEKLVESSRLIERKLRDFGISGRITEVHPGP
ncbi:MAG: DNA translocase FtsK 4TM domain-containing protein, partial [Bdellovibrionales bacterium]|nr:DNA translocase FtsK 4TM domain-containing protein [Bdellovibrionales bacterium]